MSAWRGAELRDAMDETDADLELTVVILTRNREDLIEETLASVAEQAWDGKWDVLFLDNGSTDSTPQILEQWIDKMPVPARIVNATEGFSVPYARNAAALATTARSVVYVDDDDAVALGYVAALGTALREHRFVGPRHDYHLLNDAATAAERTGQTTELNRLCGIPVVAGGGFGCNLALWRSLGGNDESFGTGQDIEFSVRVARRGDITPHFCSAAIYHVRARTNRTLAYRQGRKMGRSLVQLVATHRDVLEVTRATPGAYARRWLALTLRLRTLRHSPTNQRRWAHDVGHEAGRLRGMLAYRLWLP